MPDERLQAIRERMAAATPGPWGVYLHEVSGVSAVLGPDREMIDESIPDNAEFIANAPSDIAYLLELVESEK